MTASREHAILLVTALWRGSHYGSEPGNSQVRDMKVPLARTRSSGALPGLDHAYQQQLAALSRVRRAVATAATAQKIVIAPAAPLPGMRIAVGVVPAAGRSALLWDTVPNICPQRP